MITKIFLLSALIGIFIARIQFRYQADPKQIRRKTIKLLFINLLFALLTGLILHRLSAIDIDRYYLYLITTGISVGLFMTFERLVLKYWYMVIAVAVIAGFGTYLLMMYKTEHLTHGSFIVGMAPGIGYLIWGLINKQWKIRFNRDDSL